MAPTYAVVVDWDKDGWFNFGSYPGDPLNLLVENPPVKFLVPGGHDVAQHDLPAYSEYGRHYWSGYTGSNTSLVGYYLYVREVDNAFREPILNGEMYTLQFWARGTAGKQFRYSFQDFDGYTIAQATGTLSDDWQPFTLQGITAATNSILALLLRNNLAEDILIEVSGLMLMRGHVTAQGYNVGGEGSTVDNITGYIVGDVTWQYGMSDLGEVIAPPARLDLALDNTERAWAMENTNSPFHGLFKRDLLVGVFVNYDGVRYPQFIGGLKELRIDGDLAPQALATMRVEDMTFRLIDAEYNPPLTMDVTVDEPMQAMFDSGLLPFPYQSTFLMLGHGRLDTGRLFNNALTDFETGVTVLDYAGDNMDLGRGVQAYEFLRQLTLAEIGGRFFYEAKDAQYKFHNRQHDALNEDPIVTLDAIVDPPPQYIFGEIINSVEVTYTERAIGEVGTVMYAITQPQSLRASDIRTFTARYTLDGQSVGGIDMIPLQASVDYIANDAADGSGTDRTDTITVLVTFNASSAEVKVINPLGTIVYLTTFQLRGTPLIASETQSAHYQDSASVFAHGIQKRVYNVPYLSTASLAEDYARTIVNRNRSPVGRFNHVTQRVGASGEIAAALARRIGDRVRLFDPTLGNTQSTYVTIGFSCRISADEEDYFLTHILAPASSAALFTLDASALDGMHVLSV